MAALGPKHYRRWFHPSPCLAGLQESTPPLALKKQPGKHYIMLLERGPSESF
jgi:hypothetical protein